MYRLLFLILLVPLACTSNNPEKKVPAYTATFTPQANGPIKIKEGQNYVFGYLTVPQNRSQPNGPTIKLPVYIFKSRNPNPAPYPVLYTVGGPGYTTMTNAPYMDYYAYLDDRDLILFEQRGTAYAQPALKCPEWAQAQALAAMPAYSPVQKDSIMQRAAATCKAQLSSQNIDLNAYNTEAIAADIEDLRKALNIEKLNLLTISYSTKIAQVMLRNYPESIRSVVMDSALPLEANYDVESVSNLVASFNALLDQCAGQAACAQAFPNLKARFFTWLQGLEQKPLMLTVPHPETGQEQLFALQGKDVLALLATSQTGQVPGVPLAVEQVLNGQYEGLTSQLAGLLTPGQSNVCMGMRLAVWCAEETPFVTQQSIDSAARQYAFARGLEPQVYSKGICQVWGVQAAPAAANQPVKSQVPVLFLNGQLDPETPPRWASAMLPNFPNGFQVVFPGWAHTVTTYWSNPCGMQTANAFFNNPGQKPDLPCYNELQGAAFTLAAGQ